MRVVSGSTDRYAYFVAVDVTDLKTRETGLTTFTVYASKNGAAAAAFTTPTVNETDATNMPGVYELLLDESTSLAAGNDTEELCLHITQASMAPVTRTVELYRPETTEGNTADVTATGAVGVDWGNVENQATAVDLSGTDIQLADTVTTLTNLPAITSNWLTAAGINAGALNGKGDWNVGKTGYSLTQTFPTNFADLAIDVTTGYVDVGNWLGTAVSAASAGTPDVNIERIGGGTVALNALERWLLSGDAGIAQAGALGSITLQAGASSTDNIYNGMHACVSSGTGVNQTRLITAYNGTTKVASVTPDFTTAPSTDNYSVIPLGGTSNIVQISGDATAADNLESDYDGTGYAKANSTIGTCTTNTDVRGTDNAALASVATEARLAELDAANLPADMDAVLLDTGTTIPGTITTLQADTDDIQSRLPAALVSGAMDSDVSAMQAGAITAAAIATDAVDADALAADAVTEIRDAILPVQNVALANIEFLFVAASDHVTPVTGATGTGVTRSIDGGAFGAGTGTLAEVGNGIYQYDASAADMNGGKITFRFTGTGGTPGAPDDAFVSIVTGAGV